MAHPVLAGIWKFARSLWQGLAGRGSLIFSLFITGLLVALLLLGTEQGRIVLTRGALFAAEKLLPEFQISSGQIDSDHLGSWNFSHLTVHYREDLLLHAEQLFFEVDLGGLLKNRIYLKNLAAREMLFDNNTSTRLLEDQSAEDDARDQPPEAQAVTDLPSLRLGSLLIESLQIVDSRFEDLPPLAVSASGSYRWPELPSQLQLDVREHNGSGLHIALRGEEKEAQHYWLALSAEEKAGGFLSSQLQLPAGQALAASGRFSLWQPGDNQLLVNIEHFSLPLVEHQFSLAGRAAVTLSPWKIASDGLQLRVDKSRHRISGSISGERVDAEIHLNRLPLAISKPWQEILQGGDLSADLTVSGSLPVPAVSGTLDLNSRYSGQPLRLRSRVQTEDQVIHLESTSLQLADTRLEVDGSVDIEGESIDLNGRIQQLELENIRALLAALPETEGVEIPAELNGTVRELKISAKGPWQNPQLSAELEARAIYRQLDAQLCGMARGDLHQFTVSEIALESDVLRIEGSGSVDIDAQALELQLDVAANDLRPAEQLGLPVDEGTRVDLNAAVTVSGPWDNPQVSAQVKSEGSYRDYRYTLRGGAAGDAKKITFDRLRLDLFSDRTASEQGGEILRGPQSLIARDWAKSGADERRDRVAALAEDSARLVREGSAWLEIDGAIQPQAETAQGTLAGRNIPVSLLELLGVQLPPSLDGEISIDGQFSGAFSKPEASANLFALGSFQSEPWQLQGDVSYGNGRVEFSQFELLWAGRNQLSADGSLSEQTLDMQVRGQAQLEDLAPWFTADIADSGEVIFWGTASGSPRQPQLAGEIKLQSGGASADGEQPQKSPLSLVLDWQTQAGELQLSLDAHQGSRQAMQAKGRLAVAPILEQLFATTPASGEKPPLPLRLDASGNADLSALAAFIDPEIHAMRGQLEFNLQADGNTEDPNLRGRVDLKGGSYEHRPSNTQLKRIEFAARLTPSELRIERARAEDGEKGSINFAGNAAFAPGSPAQFDFGLTAQNAHLLNTPAAKGAFSGNLKLTGSSDDALLAGKLTLRPLAVQIEHLIGGSVPEIEVIEVEVDGPQVERARPLLEQIALAIQIVVDKQSRVRGLGLDSELRGQVDIAGTAAKPQAGGELRIVRGSFDLLGKRFNLEEGQVQFENNQAAIFVKGVHKYKDGEITAEISGTTKDMDIIFSSDPAAAQDEIFAQLLFGKSLSDISPLQAVRLVSVVRTLQSGGSTFDPVAKTRELIGLDTLDVQQEDTDEGEQYALSLGKYITNRIYIELQRSTDPLNPWQAEMQIELRRNFNLEIKSADSNESGAGSVELQWKRDY